MKLDMRLAQNGPRLRGAAVAWAALLCPSWLVLVTTSVPLYLRNQDELQHDPWVIVPFFAGAVLMPCALLPLLYAASNRRPLRVVLWSYLYGGFALLGALEVQHLAEATPTLHLVATVALAAAFVLAVWASSRRWDLRRACVPFALFAVGLVVVDAYGLLSGHVTPDGVSGLPSADRRSPETNGVAPPNLYHIVFDEYQSDVFERTLDSRVREGLGGFLFFEDTRAVYGRTRMSLASVFGGRSYDLASPQADYVESAFIGRGSLFARLEGLGYRSEAHLHEGLFAFDLPFHWVRYHRAPPAAGGQLRRAAFAELWTYAHLPEFVSASFISQESVEDLRALNAMNPEAPIKSLHSFRLLIGREPDLASSGRYVLAHLILPHFPTVLRADCTHASDGTRTGPVEQAGCATQLMLDLVATLKRLGRYRESMIVFQSDHGSRWLVRDGLVVSAEGVGEYRGSGWCGTARRCNDDWNNSRSRSLLLIKPPGRDATEPFTTSSAPASLLDGYPTVAAALGLTATPTEGVDLLDPAAVAGLRERQRYYHFFEKKHRSGWTDQMMRFRVAEGRVHQDGLVVLTNNPQP